MPKKGLPPSKKISKPALPASEFQFILFITGATPNSVRAVANVKRICETHLTGRYSLEIIDVYRQREIAEQYQLVALPLLLKKMPLPVKKIIGDFSDEAKVLSIFNIFQTK